ncbi:hypothetical protein [Arhodomonas sp. SL1]|uniref:hypothetical protein n=1 Tax=Arhodomonas sp. SL1 TaxID=3425691 RepID=UPI003F881467
MHWIWRAQGYRPRHLKLTLRGKHFSDGGAIRYNAVHNEYLVNANAPMREVVDAALGRPLHVHGSGEQARPVVHVESLAHAVTKGILGEVGSGIHDVVEANATVNEAVQVLRESDPSVEVIHTNQQARLRDLRVAPTAGNGLLPPVRRTFSEALPAMLDRIRLA